MKPPIDPRVYLVTDPACAGRELEAVVEAALRGGITLLQVREKHAPGGAFLERTLRLQALARRYGVPVLVNDRVDVALAADAAGVHVGQQDLPAAVARRLLGPDRLLGVSAQTVEEARRAERDGADYLGCVLYTTPTKPEAEAVPLDELSRIKASVRIPVVVIGGITARTAPSALARGADGLAVVSAIMQAPDPAAAAAELKALWRGRN
jgi:thiamine-phosphate pyrophosphorylase